MNLKTMIKDFIKNVRTYVDYIMKVDFRDLFVNVLILICILLLSSFIYIPVSVIKDLLLSLIVVFIKLPVVVSLLFSWVFNLISFVLAAMAFIYLFNKRFEDIEELKKQLKEKPLKTEEKKEVDEVLDLPKAKKNK